MDGSTFIPFLIVALFWFLSASSKTAKKQNTCRSAEQRPAHDAPERPVAPTPMPRQYPGNAYRPAAGFGSIAGHSLIDKEGYAVGGSGSMEGVGLGFGSIEGALIMEREGYTVGGGGLTEGDSQWAYTYLQPTDPNDAAQPHETRRTAPFDLIPLRGDDLLKGVVFSEILSRKSAWKWTR